MLSNNPLFNDLINILNNTDDNVVITDYMNYGTSLITLLELFRLNNVKTDHLHFYYTSYEENPSLIDKIRKIGFNTARINFDTIDVLHDYFTNSEHHNSRCMPKYSYTSWNNPPRDVYYNGLSPNYYNCNVHTFLVYLIYKCFYNTFIINNYNNPELDNKDLQESRIIGFFINHSEYNILDGLIVKNIYEKKYIKYKTKYLNLAKNIK
jgi:hypothetical protein